ncbi:ADP-ribosylation factor-like protein 16 isoform X2 [Rousettus aegyptiacus]|uniref:ADP-ribosylation factor-like protein 16 isoform X2 n=1 Tax=Rousettus aegyptiacus TaxID=9407 RepID=UPI00168CD180|nr:ADP-ribosylation factor-like protein 16 isoform X2 [Rousettus aegyptiacus]
MCLLLGATGVGKSLLVKRLQTILRCWARGTAASGGGVLSHGWGTPGVNGARGCWILMGAAMSPWGLEWGLWSGGVSGEAQGGIRPLPALLCPIWVLDFPAQLSSQDGKGDLGDPPPTRPTFMIDASDPTRLSASCAHLLGLLSAPPLAEASVLILFNKIDLPCFMTVEEMKSLLRLPDVIACAKQNIATAEISARKGTGLTGVLRWLQDAHRTGV